MFYGYHPSQKHSQEAREIIARKFGSGVIIMSETEEGDLPVLRKLKEQIRSGDTVIFEDITHMSPDAAGCFHDYSELYGSGVDLVFLNQRYLDTEELTLTARRLLASAKIDRNLLQADITGHLLRITELLIRDAYEQSMSGAS